MVIEGTFTISVRRNGINFGEEEDEKDTDSDECTPLAKFDFIWCDNIWHYVPKYTQNTTIRYFHNNPKFGKTKAIILTVPLMKYKEIIKKTHHERDLVKFIGKLGFVFLSIFPK